MNINNNDKQKNINNALNAYNITNENIFCDESYKNKNGYGNTITIQILFIIR